MGNLLAAVWWLVSGVGAIGVVLWMAMLTQAAVRSNLGVAAWVALALWLTLLGGIVVLWAMEFCRAVEWDLGEVRENMRPLVKG